MPPTRAARPLTAEPAEAAPAATQPQAAAQPAASEPAAAPGRERSTRGPRWRRRRLVLDPEPPTLTFTEDGRPVITVTPTDFVACSYKSCGTLRPIEEVTAKAPCPGCGRR
ncbi:MULTISPECIES: hypothetical protein [unclassified Pseudofrankia]|uniref:hypothetical protein n=1 Tax=unclassified Pseudofrankia TaxID=2994372 RepID=UPI0008D8E2A4|nr:MULTISPECIES: hypothetical protein [unclassified Pseudofrankia]MDT3441130.1 hypothetical protein [Pseudofrankia sp. BMG5.37]OHV54268.1 hypothetical protein BCD48_09375 [Pseudofrankia sp. BMG5.36]